MIFGYSYFLFHGFLIIVFALFLLVCLCKKIDLKAFIISSGFDFLLNELEITSVCLHLLFLLIFFFHTKMINFTLVNS